jgi:hypothetical protein
MAGLARPAAERSRLLFFFSGHGLEVHRNEQVLLPADYLAPPLMSLNDALSTQNFVDGLAPLAVSRQFLFVDACRNDHQELRNKKITGAQLLNVDVAAASNPGRVAPLLYATAAGQRAWEHPAPEKGLSLFGRALLDGLAGTPEIELRCTNGTCAVSVYPLQGYLKQRVAELIRAAGAEVSQEVKIGGEPADEPITYVDRATIPPGVPRAPESPAIMRRRADDVPAAGLAARRVERLLEDAFPISAEPGAAPWIARAHDLFGSERVTPAWVDGVRLMALGRGAWLGREALVVHRVDRDQGTRHYRVELEIADPDPLGHWLQVVDGAGIAHGCVLPRDYAGPPRYEIEFDVAWVERGGRPFTRLEAYLSPLSLGPLGAAAELWQRYRTADIGEAVSAFELSQLERIVRRKMASPLAATVAGLVLLRAQRLDLLHDWLCNLANYFPDRPDGAALWAEQVMREEPDRQRAIAVAAEYLGTLLERGLPHTSEGLAYAASLADRLTGAADHMSEGARHQIEKVRQALQNALVFLRPGGLFATYSHFDPETDRPPAPTGAPHLPDPGQRPDPLPTPAPGLTIEQGDDWARIGGVILRRRD